MKHHYIILLSYFDTSARKKFYRNSAFYGTSAQVEKEVRRRQVTYGGIATANNLRIDLLRVDTMTHIGTYR